VAKPLNKIRAWTEAEDQRLEHWLIVEAVSSSLAAIELTKEFPVRQCSAEPFTRNSVIGRMTRLKLHQLPAYIEAQKRKTVVPRRARGPRKKPALKEIDGQALELNAPYKGPLGFKPKGLCQWIKKSSKICGVECRGSYCDEHAARVYRPRDNPIGGR